MSSACLLLTLHCNLTIVQVQFAIVFKCLWSIQRRLHVLLLNSWTICQWIAARYFFYSMLPTHNNNTSNVMWYMKIFPKKRKKTNIKRRKNIRNTTEHGYVMNKLTNWILPEFFSSRLEMNIVVAMIKMPTTITQYHTFMVNGWRKTLPTKPVGCRNTKHGLKCCIFRNSQTL